MRNLSFCKNKWDKKYLIAFLITLICSIICGIVLYKPAIINIYFIDFADNYVYNVFNFESGPLFLTHLLSDLLYFYIFFLICYFTKFKYLTLVFLYLKGLFFGIYVAILIVLNSVGGVIVSIFVFIPSMLISSFILFFLAEQCNAVDKKIAIFVPIALALIDAIALMILVNIVFRVVIIIV